MTREIKFRAWDLDKKEMYAAIPNFEGKSALLWYGYELQESGSEDPIMQYTGLKDKNGVEIYEGDIVLIPSEDCVETMDGHSRYETNNILAEIVISPFGVLFISDELNDGYISLFALEDEYCDKEDLEVIDNIYENEELLNDK